jgi:hypothetical protein
MPGTRNRYRLYGALAMSAAVLTIAVGVDLDGGDDSAAALQRGAPADTSGVMRATHATTRADIDAVPGLRAQLHRRSEPAPYGSRQQHARVGHGTTAADIDAVPGLRAQLHRRSEPAPYGSGPQRT